MRIRTRPALRLVLLVLLVLPLLAGCLRLFRAEEPLQHFTLGAVPPSAASAASAGSGAPAELRGVSLGLRRPRLADHLATDFLVVRVPPNRVTFSRHRRWVGSLEREIGRALAEYLAARAPLERVSVVPWPAHATPDYVVELEVLRFEAVMPEPRGRQRSGEAHLHAKWEIVRAAERRVVASGSVDRRMPGWPVEDHAELVRLLDQGLAALADEILERLAEQRRLRP